MACTCYVSRFMYIHFISIFILNMNIFEYEVTNPKTHCVVTEETYINKKIITRSFFLYINEQEFSDMF